MHPPVNDTPFDATITELFLGPAEPPSQASNYSGTYGKVNAVNSSGKAVGRSMNAPLRYHASQWTGGTLTDMQALVGEYTDETTEDGWILFSSEAHAVNAGGTVVGYVATTEKGRLPFLGYVEVRAYMAVLNMTGIFPGAALAINKSGQVAGYSFKRAEIHSHSIYQSGQHAVLWDNGTTTSLLGDVSEGDHSLASGINDHGQVVGEATTAWFQGGFLWQNGQITPVGDVRVRPRAINNSGQIAGRFHVGTSTRAFLWQYGTLSELPMLPGHGISDAFSINAAGQAVGFSQDPDPVNTHTRRAVIWSGGVVQDLTAMLPPNSGWTLGMAFGISEAGHVVGLGLHQGLRKGFLMTLPREPVVSDQ